MSIRPTSSGSALSLSDSRMSPSVAGQKQQLPAPIITILTLRYSFIAKTYGSVQLSYSAAIIPYASPKHKREAPCLRQSASLFYAYSITSKNMYRPGNMVTSNANSGGSGISLVASPR